MADGGTLLLDEISEMNPLLQAKLLRVLQEREFEKIGDSRTIYIDVRIVATTNRDIQQCIREGKFREDLFFRLNVIPIKLPSLSERREDVPLLVQHFVNKFSAEHNREITGISDQAMSWLQNQEWQGNVRELENAIERAVVLCTDKKLQLPHFQQDFAPAAAHTRPLEMTLSSDSVSTISEMEKRMIIHALRVHDNNRTRAAEALGISIRTLRNKLRDYREEGIDIP